MRRRWISGCCIIPIIASLVCPTFFASAATITVDGDVSEWKSVTMQESSNSKIAQWAVMQDDEYVYFYIQQNGGNEYGLPITETQINVSYDGISWTNSSMIQFSGMMDQVRDAYYSEISGTVQAYAPSKEADKYESEVAIPKSFFAEEEFTLSYCGTTVESTDIPYINEVAQPEATEAVYEGIVVDGNFYDWDAVAKTTVDDDALVETAMVFDGDYVYIYIKEKYDGAATSSGENSNGKFTIYTDLGRNTTFKLNKDSLDGIEGATVVHSNKQYEIAIPVDAVKQYNETISFGYYMEEEMLIQDVANLQESSETKEFTGITYDGVYSDWDYYPHQLVQYSTSGGVGEDAEAALYLDDTTLYGHVLSTLHMNEKEFQPFTIRFNEDDETAIGFRLVAVDEDGNIDFDAKLDGLDAGTYEYYLWDLESGSTATNIYEEGAPVFGKIYLTVNKTADGTAISDEAEYQIDLEKVAAYLDLEVSDMKMIQANYINIGSEWVTIAGTSSGAVMGISLCGLSVLAVWIYRKKKLKVA